MQVRIAGTQDAVEILRLAREYAQADHHAFDEAHTAGALHPLLVTDAHGVVLVADVGDHLDGYAVLTWGYGLESGGVEALLDEIYVQSRGQGTGTRLLSAVIEYARSHGARTIFLETEAHNDTARAFYRHHGFAVEDSVWMRRELTP